jgi:hypothetical protein
MPHPNSKTKLLQVNCACGSDVSAGNIRLEEGKPSDLWYSSCVDLVASRFNASDYDASLGVTGEWLRHGA